MEQRDGEEFGTFRIEVTGLVQGVGFRPFIYRLAREHQVPGTVENRNDGVVILINATREGAERFKDSITGSAPPAADIESVRMFKVPTLEFADFSIRKSGDVSDHVTEISPDIAVCPACLEEMKQQPHRLNYPFINCTHCGPRFSIITALPYDRPHTTMDAFTMCPLCRSEYEDILDRRFHAQPIACNHCGPVYTLHEGDQVTGDLAEILVRINRGLSEGKVYALKGMGGFHLMCDAFNETGVSKLREVKKRDGKPFAVMFRNISDAQPFVEISREEEELMTSWRRPIVLLKRKGATTPGIADGLSTLGIMLPYMPFHSLLFEALDSQAIVLTSGNFSDEPILLSNQEALEQFGGRVDGMVVHNREIFNRNDDSVAMVVDHKPRLIRRSRGYAPSPLRLTIPVEGIFASGAELTGAFCMGKGNQAIMSQYIGDLKNFETLRFYEEAYDRFSRMFRFSPRLIVHDLHPDYLSSKFAGALSERNSGIPLLGVQHHHAHVASVMMDHNLEGEVIGISFDGMGLGTDGKIWGAEVLVAGYLEYRRICHFEYMPLPGGDVANREPWRMAVSYLYLCFGEEFSALPLPMFREIDPSGISGITQMIDRGLNTPLISSAGRLFDAVSAILGINYRATYQAEAPMRLESMADPAEKGRYPYELMDGYVSWMPMIKSIVDDAIHGVSNASISGKFHNTLVEMLLELAGQIRRETGNNRVVLSGGSFQNRILTENLVLRTRNEGFEVYLPGKVPVNDQGIALGQLAIGAAWENENK
jgi:hydrogenase maturation protein HypF